MLDRCWADVVDGGPTSDQHWVDVTCLLGILPFGFTRWYKWLASTLTNLKNFYRYKPWISDSKIWYRLGIQYTCSDWLTGHICLSLESYEEDRDALLSQVNWNVGRRKVTNIIEDRVYQPPFILNYLSPIFQNNLLRCQQNTLSYLSGTYAVITLHTRCVNNQSVAVNERWVNAFHVLL